MDKNERENMAANIELAIEDVEFIREGALRMFNNELADFMGCITANLRQNVAVLRQDKPKRAQRKRSDIKLAINNVK